MNRALLSNHHRCTCHGRRGKGASGQATALHRSGRRVRRLPCDARSRGRVAELTSLTAFDFVQTTATSQMLTRAAREAASPGLAGRAGPWGPAVRKAQTVPRTVCVPAHLLGAPEARRGPPERAFADGWCLVFVGKEQPVAARQAMPGGGDFWGDEQRRPGVGARSAHPHLTRRGCLNGANEVSKVSSAARPQAEQRSAVAAQRRPPQHEPSPGAACRATQTSQ
jgi:hypothetical protein